MKKKVIITVLAGCAVVCLSTVYFQHRQNAEAVLTDQTEEYVSDPNGDYILSPSSDSDLKSDMHEFMMPDDASEGLEKTSQSDAYDLSKKDAYEVTLSCSGTEAAVCAQTFVTNSTEIHVSAEPSEPVTVYLYAADDTAYSLLEGKLDGKSDITFTNLTSAQTYAVGVQTDKEATVELTVTD